MFVQVDGAASSTWVPSRQLTLPRGGSYARQMPKTAMAELQRTPLRAGEPVLIIDDRNRQHVLRLQAGYSSHHGRAGLIAHDRIIGCPPGLSYSTSTGRRFSVVRPSLENYLLKVIKRHTQILYPKDLGNIVVQGNLFSSARVLEAGLGSASAALLLLRLLGEQGELISYERNPEFAELARRTLEEFDRFYGSALARHRIVVGDIYEGIPEKDLDTILLDVAEPQSAQAAAAQALRPNGTLLCWLPTVLQVFVLVRVLQQNPEWAEIQVTETLMRPWRVAPTSVRPAHKMVGHTGFLISARRVVQRSL